MRAWLLAKQFEDKTHENRRETNVDVSEKELNEIGVTYRKMDAETMLDATIDHVENGETIKICAVDKLMKDDGYANRDEVCCCLEKLPNLPDLLVKFFEEHIHEDDEIRLIKEGIGYFDIRNKDDEWVRIEVAAGDLIVLPAGSYHRFTLNKDKYVHAIRLFATVPAWTPINRPCEENEFRKEYLLKYNFPSTNKRERSEPKTDDKAAAAVEIKA